MSPQRDQDGCPFCTTAPEFPPPFLRGTWELGRMGKDRAMPSSLRVLFFGKSGLWPSKQTITLRPHFPSTPQADSPS